MIDFEQMLGVLKAGQVEFVVVGGFAATTHGSARFTQDLDVVYARSPENIARLTSALAPLHPYLRGAPPGLPFRFDEPTVKRGLNFTLTTDLGDLDLLGEIAGGGLYSEILPFCETTSVFSLEILRLNLHKLIEVKRAAGRPKDFEAIAELEILLELQSQL